MQPKECLDGGSFDGAETVNSPVRVLTPLSFELQGGDLVLDVLSRHKRGPWGLFSHSFFMTEGNASQGASKQCGGTKRAMLAYGGIQITATAVSAISLAAIALSLRAMKQENKAFNGYMEEVMTEGNSNSQAVRFCNGGQ